MKTITLRMSKKKNKKDDYNCTEAKNQLNDVQAEENYFEEWKLVTDLLEVSKFRKLLFVLEFKSRFF